MNVVPTYSAAAVCQAFSRGQPGDEAAMFAPTLNHMEDEGEICLSNILLLSFHDLSFGWCCLNMKVSPMDSCVWTLGPQLMVLPQKVVECLGGGVLVEEVLYWGQTLRLIDGSSGWALSALCMGMQCDRFPCLHTRCCWPGDLSSIPRTYIKEEEEKWLHKVTF